MSTDDQLFFKIAANQTNQKKKAERKSFPNNDFILFRTDDDGNKPRLEINIANETANQIIDYYETNTFGYTVNDMCGVLCFIPNGEGLKIKICKNTAGSSHHTISIKRVSEQIFSAVGEFRRMFAVVAICQDGFLVVPDRKNENNEYEDKQTDAA